MRGGGGGGQGDPESRSVADSPDFRRVRLDNDRGNSPWTGGSNTRGVWIVQPDPPEASDCCRLLRDEFRIALPVPASPPGLVLGKLLSFVYDIADLYRVDVIVPVAFEAVVEAGTTGHSRLESVVRHRCRDAFAKARILARIVKDIDDLMQLSPADIERSSLIHDGSDESPGDLWDPDRGSIPGGHNHGADPGPECDPESEG